MSVELLHPWEYAHTALSSPEEIAANLASGVLDEESALHYQQKHDHLVEVVHRGADGEIKAIRLSGNLRSNAGGDWQALSMGGGVVFGASGTATNASATALYASSAVNNFTASAASGYIVACGPNAAGTGATVFGLIGANSASCTYMPVDKWYSSASSIGTQTGPTPNATATFQILGLGIPGRFIALSNTAGNPSSTDTTLPGEITSNGLARAEATFAHTAVSGASSGTETSTYTLSNTFTATGTQSALRAAVFGSSVQSTAPLIFTNTFSSVSMIANDTLAVTWTIAL